MQGSSVVDFPRYKTEVFQISLHTYTAESIQVVGTMQVHVKYGDYAGEQKLFVIKGGKTSLMGCDWLQDIRLDWKSLGVARIQSGSLCILRQNKRLFEEGQRTIKSFKAKLSVQTNAKPKFY